MNRTVLATAVQALEACNFAEVDRLCRSLPPAERASREFSLLRALALGGAGHTARSGSLLDRLFVRGLAHPRRDLGDLLVRLGRHAEAIAQYRAAVRKIPDDMTAWHALGLALAETGDFPAAEDAFRRCTMLDPAQAGGWSNLGMLLKVQLRFADAIAAHDRAAALAPGDPRIRVNRAVALLHAGRLTEAWQDYEYRLLLAGRPVMPPGRLLPDIESIDLRDQAILVWHEEGFGDTLQFSRYVPALAEAGARVYLAVPPQLVRLMRDGLHGGTVLDPGAPFPAYDYQCPVFSLPRAFGTTLETIPAPIPYLRAAPDLVAAWRRRLPQAGYLVGVVWAGQARPWLAGFATLNARRSLDPAKLRPLSEIASVRVISLQNGVPAPGFMHNPMAAVTDFADTAAIIENLDLVVSVDTAVIHLAGAMGKPAILLDRYDNCWRWFSGREDSPWYPRLRILRQQRLGDWSDPLRRAAELIRGMVAKRSGRS